MRLALQASDFNEPVPNDVCASCYSEMSSITSRGAKLRAEKSAKEQSMKILWRNRLKLLKGAKQKTRERNFKEASALYEKYLRTVELVFDKPPGGLQPDDFKGIKQKELTAITSVYWDLIRIYDTGSRFDDRISLAAKQLVKFFPFSKGQA
ncbi:MAG: hypothetical protein KDD25_08935, partial [Bdellovibrionales bacterium]|nr:hypothetical protein [Bdellovibrionales bacterium]